MKNGLQRYLPLGSLIFVIGALVLFGTPQNEKPQALKTTDQVTPHRTRRPAQMKRVKPLMGSRSLASNRPTDFSRMVIPNNEVKLSSVMVLAKNIVAIPKRKWKPGMKPFLWENGQYGFFEKTSGETGGIPVSYNTRNNQFYVVSSILHVSGVDPEMREKLLETGLKEYLYFKKIKFLSLKSSSDDVVKVYTDLKKKGYAVSLEVLKDRPVAH